jgi:hypothetical protein
LVGAGADVNLTLVGLEDVRAKVLMYLPLLRELVAHPSVEAEVAFNASLRFGLNAKFSELKEVAMAGWGQDEFRAALDQFDNHSSIGIARQLVGDARFPLDVNGRMCLAARMKHEDWLHELATMEGADPLTLLRAASKCGSLDLISHALGFVPVDDINKDASPHGIGRALHGSALALARSDPQIVRLLCASEKIDKELALVVACELGLADLCVTLLERGSPIEGLASTELDDESGRCTPLTAAAAYGRADIVKLLLKKNAGVNEGNCHAIERLCSGVGLRRVIDQAPTTLDGLADSLRELLKAGAVTDVCDSDNCRCDSDNCQCSDVWDSDRLSAVESVCRHGLVTLLRVFIDECSGADVNETYGCDPPRTPLEAACMTPTSRSLDGQVEVIHFLRARGAKVSQKLLDGTSSSALYRALTESLEPAEVALELATTAVDDLERRLALARKAEREVKAALEVIRFADGTARPTDSAEVVKVRDAAVSKHLKAAIRHCGTAEAAWRWEPIELRRHCES